ncbi:MAG: hypothetical protein IJ158_11610 [Treponema sp.]|nr:hypothetical protein [Treponema sp.]
MGIDIISFSSGFILGAPACRRVGLLREMLCISRYEFAFGKLAGSALTALHCFTSFRNASRPYNPLRSACY